MNHDLDIQFQEAYKIASNLETKLPPDVMLKLYAFYKQGVEGDRFSMNANTKSLRGAFKFNAWIQLRGMTPDEAKKEYIKLVHTLTI